MDAGIITGIVTAFGGAVAAVIGALALFKKAAAPNSRALTQLRSLWDWIEFNNYTPLVPNRLAKAVLALLDQTEEQAPK